MNELALFAGAGGGILGGTLLGWHTVGSVEIERYPRECLLQRQRDGILPHFPIWDDVTTFDGKPWRGLVDVVSGGFPCQDISAAGKGAGIDGARSGLWSEMFRIICEVRPRFAFMENSPMLTARGLGRVLGDLAASGYHAAWLVLGASDVGALHVRKRIWILAQDSLPAPYRAQRTGVDIFSIERPKTLSGSWNSCSGRKDWNAWETEPAVGRVADGVARRVDRLRAIGNGQVPLVAATAFCFLKKTLERELSHG